MRSLFGIPAMESVLHKIAEDENRRNLEVIYQAQAKYPAGGLKKSDVYISISDRKCEIFDSSKKTLHSEHWISLTRFKITNNDIYMNFGKERISFVMTEPKIFCNHLVNLLPTMLTQREMQKLDIPGLAAKKSSPNLQSILKRVLSKAEMLKLKDYNDVMNKIESVVTFHENTVSLVEFQDQAQTLQILLDILPLCPFVSSLFVSTAAGYDPFPYLAEFASINESVDVFRIEGPITNTFDKFLNAITKNKNRNISYLTFDGTHFNNANLRELAHCVSSKPITSVGFRNAINSETTATFYNFFLPGPVGKVLKFICIDAFPSINTRNLIKGLPNLSVLSITKCNVEITKVFEQLKDTNIRSIDLSGNICAIPPSNLSIAVPNSLSHFVLSEVIWEPKCFIGMFKFIQNIKPHNLKLNFSQAEMPTADWVDFFIYIKDCKIDSLKELTWNNNPIHVPFFNFLLRNTKLNFLSIAETLHEGDPSSIIAMCNYIVSAKSLKTLILKSNESTFPGKFTVSLLSAVLANGEIENLDITSSHCGDAGVTMLKALIKAVPLKSLECDGAYPTSATSYSDFIESAAEFKEKRDFKLSFPTNDLSLLVKIRKMRHARFDQLKDLMKGSADFLFKARPRLESTAFIKNASSGRRSTASFAELPTIEIGNLVEAHSEKLEKSSSGQVTIPTHHHRRRTKRASSAQTLDATSVKTLDAAKSVIEEPTTVDHSSTRRHKRRKKRSDSSSDFLFCNDDIKDVQSIHSMENEINVTFKTSLKPKTSESPSIRNSTENDRKSSKAESPTSVLPPPQLNLVLDKPNSRPSWEFPADVSNIESPDWWKNTEKEFSLPMLLEKTKKIPTAPHPQ